MIDSARFHRRCLQSLTSSEPAVVHTTTGNGMEGYVRLQWRLMVATVLVSLVAFAIAAFSFDLHVAISLLVGSCAGLLYLRLLARSVGRLSGESRQIGKFQLVVPTLLIVAAAKFPQLDLIPSFLGFLLFKPALILQAVLDT